MEIDLTNNQKDEGEDKSWQTAVSFTKEKLLMAIHISDVYKTDPLEELKEAIDDMLKRGVGEHRVREAAGQLTPQQEDLVLQALQYAKTGISPSKKHGVELEDPKTAVASFYTVPSEGGTPSHIRWSLHNHSGVLLRQGSVNRSPSEESICYGLIELLNNVLKEHYTRVVISTNINGLPEYVDSILRGEFSSGYGIAALQNQLKLVLERFQHVDWTIV